MDDFETQEKEPADLEIRIGTKKQAVFDKLLRAQEETITRTEVNLEIDKVVRDYCVKRIKEEKLILEEQKE